MLDCSNVAYRFPGTHEKKKKTISHTFTLQYPIMSLLPIITQLKDKEKHHPEKLIYFKPEGCFSEKGLFIFET